MPQAISEPTRVAASRRQFLVSGLAASIVASPAAAHALIPANADAELVQLGSQIEQLHTQFEAACRLASQCSVRFKEMKPEFPDALWQRFGDDLDLPSVVTRDESGKKRSLYCFAHIDKELRGQTNFARWGTNATEEELRALGVADWQDNRILPIAGHDHLFFSVGDENRKRRAIEIVLAYDQYVKARDEANTRSGYSEAETTIDDVNAQMDAIVHRMLELKPSTLAGMKALATALRLHCWCGEIDESESQEESLMNHMIRSLTEGGLQA